MARLKWIHVPTTANNWALPDKDGMALRHIGDRGPGFGDERFIASGNGHGDGQKEAYHASLDEAKAAAVASLTESQLASAASFPNR
jgi:hypothetical protein